ICGDSLIGASAADIARQAPPRTGRRASSSTNADTPLFSDADLEPSVAAAVLERNWIAEAADDSVEIVRQKERRLEQLQSTERWKALADLWCACWIWPSGEHSPGGAVFGSLRDQLITGRRELAAHIADPLLRQSQAIARSRRF